MATVESVLPGLIAFLAHEIGRIESAITKSTKINSLGIDGFALARIGQDINRLSWLHGAEISVHELLQCTTVEDLAQLLARKIK